MASGRGRVILLAPGREIEVPILALDRLGRPAVGAKSDLHVMSGRDRLHAREGGAPPAEREKSEEMVESAWICPWHDRAGGDQRLDLGAEIKGVALPRPEQRANADPIARQQHDAASEVDQGKSELPLQMLEKSFAVLLIEMDDDLGVGARGKDVTLRLKLLLELGIVEQLAIEDDRDRAILVEDGLPAIAKTDDAEATVSEANTGSNEESVIVGSPVPQRVGHALQHRLIGMTAPLEIDNPGQTAHRRLLRAISSRGLTAGRRLFVAMECRFPDAAEKVRPTRESLECWPSTRQSGEPGQALPPSACAYLTPSAQVQGGFIQA